MRCNHVLGLISASLLSGCFGTADNWDDDLDNFEQGIVSDNGRSLNGTSLNGRSLNGRSLNGRSLNGVSLTGATLSSNTLSSIALNGSQITAKKGTVGVSGTQLVGSLWNGTLDDGSKLVLRIDNAAALTTPNTDTWAYGVSYSADGGWYPLCGDATVKVIPLVGTFNNGAGVTGGGSYTNDTTRLTFACRGYAIAKCMELGYKPWKTGTGGVNLRNHMVACTRMLRADYCGNGNSYTVDGNSVNLYDKVGVQSDTDAWRFDAEWTTAGARCVKQTTMPRTTVAAPSCYTAKISSTCGATTGWAAGTLVMNEIP